MDAGRATEELARKLDRFRLADKDILCVRSGAMSEPAIVEEAQSGWLFGGNLLRLRITDPESTDPQYLLAYLSLPEVKNWIRARSDSGVIPTITAASLGELTINLPPIDEQRRIGSALSMFDQQIVEYRRVVAMTAEARSSLAEDLLTGLATFP